MSNSLTLNLLGIAFLGFRTLVMVRRFLGEYKLLDPCSVVRDLRTLVQYTGFHFFQLLVKLNSRVTTRGFGLTSLQSFVELRVYE